MPCHDSGPSYTYSQEVGTLEKKLKLTEAMLCAVLAAINSKVMFAQIMAIVDENEEIGTTDAGISSAEIRSWWMKHQKADQARREAEAKQRRELETRKAALAKLTPEEKKLLGLNG